MDVNRDTWTALVTSKQIEGGWSDRPVHADPGGPTNIGITLPTLSKWLKRPATKADLKKVTPELARQIAVTFYWAPMRCDDWVGGVDIYGADFGWNSGTTTAIQVLQQTLGVDDDGHFGKLTLAAMRAKDPETLLRDYHDARMSYLHTLDNWAENARGWANRCLLMKAEALKHVQARPLVDEMAKSTIARVNVPVAGFNFAALMWIWEQYGSQIADMIQRAAQDEHITGAAAALAEQPALPKILLVVCAICAVSLVGNGVTLWNRAHQYLKPKGV